MPRDHDLPEGSQPGVLSGVAPGLAATAPGASERDTAPDAGPDGAHERPLDTPEAQRYARRQVLGVGGMGRVVLARDLRLGRDVALKEVSGQQDPDAGRALAARLAREAEVTARLEHPGIVPVYDAGRNPDGSIYYTMRVVRGRSLDDALQSVAARPADLAQRMRFLRHVLDASQAVAWAHRHGIVHRDLKPANIMVGEFGETQVVDWGLARPVSGAEAPIVALAGDDAQLTTLGAAVGTPHYMSPEQAQGLPADQRADVWALGFVLFEVLVGRRARPAPSASDALAEARVGLPRLALDGLPPDLAAIIRRATGLRPADRYADAKALADDLAAFLDGRRVTAHAYTPWELVARLVRAWRVPLLVAGAALVALAVAIGLGFARTAAERDRAECERAVAEAARERATQAEAEARVALARAEDELAHALAGAARRYVDHLAWPEAEVTAAAALSHGEDPDARGILAALAGGPRPRRVASVALPDCLDLIVASDGERAVCRSEDALSLLALGSGQALWRRAGPWAAPVLYEAQNHVAAYVAGSGHRIRRVVLSAETGDYRSEDSQCCYIAHPTRRGDAMIGRSPDGLFAFAASERVAVHIPAACGVVSNQVAVTSDLGRLEAYAPCPDGLFILAALEPDAGPDRVPVTITEGRFGADAPAGLGYAAAFVPHRRAVIVGTNKGEAALVTLPDGRIERRVSGLTGVVAAIDVSEDGGIAALRDEVFGIALWDLTSGVLLGRLPVEAGSEFRFLVTAPRRLVTWDRHRATTWDLPPGRPRMLALGGGVSGLDLSSDGRQIAVGATESLEVYDLARGARTLARGYHGIVKGAAWSADDQTLAVAIAAEESLELVDVEQGLARRPLRPPVARRVARLGAEDFVHLSVWGYLGIVARDGAVTSVGAAENGGVDLAVTPDHQLAVALISPSEALRVRLGGARHPAPEVESLALEAACGALAPSPDGDWLACTSDGTVVLLDAEGRALGVLAAEPGLDLVDVAWSPDGHWIAAGGKSGTVHVWDSGTRRLVARLADHRERAAVVAFEPGGRWLVSGGWDDTLRFVDLAGLERPGAALLAEAEAAWGLTRADVLGR